MTFSSEWEMRYVENTHLSVWPWSDVVSLVHRHCKLIIEGGGRVLELGCGAGANIPLLRSLGIDYYAIEGSPTIVTHLHERYPDLVDNIVCGDFTVTQPFSGQFDVVIDRGALTHNTTKAITKTLQLAFNSMRPSGIFIGSDWFSRNHSDAVRGDHCDDDYTRNNVDGQFKGVGKVHFSDEMHLRDLFKNFEIVYLEEKLARRFEPKDNHQFASWNIVARKPCV